jgi:cytoskeletal protein CcmA (bactofilin family)
MLEVNRKPSNLAGAHKATPKAGPITSVEIAENHSQQAIATQEATRTPAPFRQIVTAPILVQPLTEAREFQSRSPVITGEIRFKGLLPVDGTVSGQLGGVGGSLGVRQKSRLVSSEPELSGEISFQSMLRVNGHVAGTVYSQKGTLIIDAAARVDANVEVAIAVIGGTVNGDVVAHERVEIGPGAKIYGNIWTKAISIKDGAIFEGVCRMIGEECASG